MKTVRIYKDLDLSFTPHPGTGDVGMKFDINSVKQSLRILLLTSNGERPFNYILGSPIYNVQITANMMHSTVYSPIFGMYNWTPYRRLFPM